jgi:hypothetical protein
MDHELLKGLARFKILIKQKTGESIDITKLIKDRDYATEVFARGSALDSEEAEILMIDLQDRLGRFAPSAGVTYSAHINAPEKANPAVLNAEVVVAPEVAPEAKPAAPAKYVLGARG